MTCLANGTWSPEVVVCAPMMCDIATLPAFSEVVAQTARVSTTTTITTTTNYLNIVDRSDIFGYPAHSKTTTTESSRLETPETVFQQDDEIEIKCADGYIMFNAFFFQTEMLSTNLKCSEGKWMADLNQDFICLPVICAQVPAVQNAVVEVRNEPDVEAKYVCLNGYGLEDKPAQTTAGVNEPATEFSIYCSGDTGWEIPPVLGCFPVGCGPISLPVQSGLQVNTVS